MPSALLIATMETEHFTFSACGATVKTAKEYLLQTWLKHLEQMGVPPGTLTTVPALEGHYGINVTRWYAGIGRRDHTQIWEKERF